MSSGIKSFIAELLADADLAAQITCHKQLPGKAASHGESRIPWSAAVASLLSQKNIRLYSHQALAADHARAGHSIVVSTPTASGKSLIYNLPVLERYLLDPEAKALYLFPLKALAQDQLASFNKLASLWPVDSRPVAALYDGDTPAAERQKIRKEPPAVLMSNPEMLHLSLLPHHEKWASFLAGLSVIVVDEAHAYRGIFGSHMAQVFRRLNRITARYGARPQYVFCTATLGNPVELASGLMDARPENPPVSIAESGAPMGKRHFVFINPLQAASTCAIDLLKRALRQNLRVIVYCRSRRMTELINIWASEDGSVWKDAISSYRAGYLPEERRDIEKRMASGELKAVISTSALELGIDIGGLDLCILVGYPGSIMQTLQRSGRVGRSLRDSAVILIAGEDALDQYFIRNPEDFFSRPSEKAVINPDNAAILEAHLECAAAESPLNIMEDWLQKGSVRQAIQNLENKGLLLPANDGREWLAAARYPQDKLDLRGCGQSYTLEDTNGRIIGALDGFRAWKEAHPGAVYLHHGHNYIVEELDSGRMRIIAREGKVNWFTRTRGHKSTDIIREEKRISLGNCAVFQGRLRVSEFITGYEKRSTQGQRLLSISPLNAPPHIFETDGLWIVIPDDIRKKLENEFVHFMGSIHALEHAAIGLLPLEVMADRNDFGGISIPMHYQLGLPAVFIYDAFSGGAGLSRSAFGNIGHILAATLNLVSKCLCEDGCPSCIHSPKCGSGNRPLSKSGARKLLEAMLEDGDLGKNICNSLRIAPAPDRLSPQPHAPQKAMPAEKPAPNARKTAKASEIFFQRLESGAFSRPAAALPKSSAAPENYVVFDVETRKSSAEVGGWKNASRMGVSVACLYESKTDKFYAYEQDELEIFFQRLAKADLVVGFNSFRFDYEALSPLAEIMAPPRFRLRNLPGLDLLQVVAQATGCRISLDNLCQATLNAPKSANGLLALRWWKEGEIDKIKQYCQRDVQLTRDLYLYGLQKGELFYTNKAGAKVRFSVDFSMGGNSFSKNGNRICQ